MADRARRGAVAHAAGLLAEEAAARAYEAKGYAVAARRWRSAAGEADLVLRGADGIVVAEVKRAATLEAAAPRLSRRQMDRLAAAAALFCEGEPLGGLTPVRLDLALVDALGRVLLIENAFGADW